MRSAGDRRSARGAIRIEVSAEAQASPPSSIGGMPTTASGGGYSGRLAHRQGKPMRPDVAAAFDRMAAAARRAGISLVISSAYRSDAEQARLFAQHPDPRWVAPPGRSLHRCATELDLGPSSAYGWLAENAPRFGFLKRYSWEPWHFGYAKWPCAVLGGGERPGCDAADRGRAPGGPRAPRLRPAAVPRADRARCGALERLRGTARRPAPGRVELQPVRRLGGRRPGDRPVHARHRPAPTGCATPSTLRRRSTPRRT